MYYQSYHVEKMIMIYSARKIIKYNAIYDSSVVEKVDF